MILFYFKATLTVFFITTAVCTRDEKQNKKFKHVILKQLLSMVRLKMAH